MSLKSSSFWEELFYILLRYYLQNKKYSFYPAARLIVPFNLFILTGQLLGFSPQQCLIRLKYGGSNGRVLL